MQYLNFLEGSVARSLALLLAFSALAGCSLFKSSNDGPEPAPLVKFKPEIKLKTLWSANAGDDIGKKYLKFVPGIDAGQVFAADVDGRISARDQASGKRLWRKRVKAEISGGVGAGYGQAFVGTADGELIALSADNGEILWRSQVSSEILCVPQSNGDVVIVQTLDEKVYAFDHKTGEQRWLYEGVVPSLTLRGTSSPVLTPIAALVGLANGKLVALNVDNGQVLWEQRLSAPKGRSELERMTDVDGTPLLLGSKIYATGYKGSVAAIDASTARVLWRRELSSEVGPGEGFGQLYVVESDGDLTALDIEKGELVWKQKGLEYRGLTAPVGFGNYVVVGDADGYLHFMSQIDGRFVARKKIDGDGLTGNLVAKGDTLYVYGNSGKLVALQVK